MGKKEKKAFEEKIKKDVKKDKQEKHESDEDYLRRVMGEKAVKKPLNPIDPIHLKDNNKIITHEDQERY